MDTAPLLLEVKKVELISRGYLLVEKKEIRFSFNSSYCLLSLSVSSLKPHFVLFSGYPWSLFNLQIVTPGHWVSINIYRKKENDWWNPGSLGRPTTLLWRAVFVPAQPKWGWISDWQWRANGAVAPSAGSPISTWGVWVVVLWLVGFCFLNHWLCVDGNLF